MVLMFEKKKKDKKNEDLMKKAPAENAVALSFTDLEATAGGYGIYAQDGKSVALAGVCRIIHGKLLTLTLEMRRWSMR